MAVMCNFDIGEPCRPMVPLQFQGLWRQSETSTLFETSEWAANCSKCGLWMRAHPLAHWYVEAAVDATESHKLEGDAHSELTNPVLWIRCIYSSWQSTGWHQGLQHPSE